MSATRCRLYFHFVLTNIFQSSNSTLTNFKSWATRLTFKKQWMTSPDEVNMPVTHGLFKTVITDDSLIVQPPIRSEDSLSISSIDFELFTNNTNIPLPLREQPPLRLPEFGQDSILVKPSPDNSHNNNWILLPSSGR